MQFWADYWRDNNVSCSCSCHQIKRKKKEHLSLLTPKKKGEKLNSRETSSSDGKKKRGSSRRKSKSMFFKLKLCMFIIYIKQVLESVESSKSDSVLLSGKFPHFHAPKPEQDSP